MVWALLAVAIYDGLCASKPSEDIGELKRSDWSPCGSVRSLLWLVSITSGGVGSRKPASEQQRPPCLHAPSCRPTPHDPMPLPPTPLLPRPFLTHLEYLHKEAMVPAAYFLVFPFRAFHAAFSRASQAYFPRQDVSFKLLPECMPKEVGIKHRRRKGFLCEIHN